MAEASTWLADLPSERRPIASLVPYARNARVHSPAQVDQIAASMQEFGVVWPALVDEAGEIIAGHGRVLAASKLDWPDYPVIVAKGWTAKQIKAYRIADNKLALNSAWDVKLLAAEMGELVGLDALIGFGEGELEALLAGADANGMSGGMSGGEGRPPPTEEEARKTLADRFGIPPFTVLNARAGWWQDRKRAWIALGIESELGRGENLLSESVQDRARVLLGVRYEDAGKWVDERRGEGLSDDAILAAAAEAGTAKKERAAVKKSEPVKKKPAKKKRAGSKLTMSKTIQREKPHADKAADGDKRRERASRKVFPGQGQDLVRQGYQKNGGST